MKSSARRSSGAALIMTIRNRAKGTGEYYITTFLPSTIYNPPAFAS